MTIFHINHHKYFSNMSDDLCFPHPELKKIKHSIVCNSRSTQEMGIGLFKTGGKSMKLIAQASQEMRIQRWPVRPPACSSSLEDPDKQIVSQEPQRLGTRTILSHDKVYCSQVPQRCGQLQKKTKWGKELERKCSLFDAVVSVIIHHTCLHTSDTQYLVGMEE